MRTTDLRALLFDALIAGAAITAGCGEMPAKSGTAPAGSVPRYEAPAHENFKCVGDVRNILRDLNPAQRIDYVELRSRYGSSRERTSLARGRPCEHAASADACHQALRAPATEEGFAPNHNLPGRYDSHLVVTDAVGVRRLVSIADLIAFTGPIDTPGEALLLAFAYGHDSVLRCDVPAPVKVGDDWELTVHKTVELCPEVVADVTIGILRNGGVNVVRTANRTKTGLCVGRRPPGLRTARASSGGAVGSYLSHCAHLEAASVPAFERLAGELEALEAPVSLARLCRRAADDEGRHARIMNRLTRAYGGRASMVVLDDAPARDAATVSLDNAAEGCVRETFGALVGMYQAVHARDRRVRAAMRAIASDEIRHAALAWKIATWIEPLLSPRDADRVERGRARAVRELRAELCSDPPAELRAALGLPGAAVATRMAEVLERTLWAAA